MAVRRCSSRSPASGPMNAGGVGTGVAGGGVREPVAGERADERWGGRDGGVVVAVLGVVCEPGDRGGDGGRVRGGVPSNEAVRGDRERGGGGHEGGGGDPPVAADPSG